MAWDNNDWQAEHPHGRSQSGPPAGDEDVSASGTAMYPLLALLTVTSPGAQRGTSVPVEPGGTVLGRAATCDLVLPSPRVSRRHAVVRATSEGFLVEDLGSRNGTFVNGQPALSATPLHDGDRVSLAGVDVEFHLAASRTVAAPSSVPMPREPWQPQAFTEPVGIEQSSPGPNQQRSLRQELRNADGFSTKALTLAVFGSLVGTVLTTAAGTGQWGSLAGAAVAPVTTTVFTTKRAGETGRVRTAAIIILSLTALVITWAGISAAETARGTAVIPGADRTSTLPDLDIRPPGDGATNTTPPSRLSIDVDPVDIDCGPAAVGTELVCPMLTIRSTRTALLHIARLKITGADAADFDAELQCKGKRLRLGDTCEVAVAFTPSEPGEREATLVVYLSDTGEAKEATVSVTGAGTRAPDECREGFEWRLVDPSDHVCVTRETREQVLEDNALADSRRSPTGGPYGPDTCLEGYVWREALPGDHVCVLPETRAQAERDNAEAEDRRAR